MVLARFRMPALALTIGAAALALPLSLAVPAQAAAAGNGGGRGYTTALPAAPSVINNTTFAGYQASVFALPKGGKDRHVPLPGPVSLALAAHLERFPAAAVTLPWLTSDGKPRTEELVFRGAKGGVLDRAEFNAKVWGPARRRAGVPDGKDADAAGMHQLRHYYASSLKMSRVASGATFDRSHERLLPAAQRAARVQARRHGSQRTLRDLGCHRPLASGRTMLQPVRLQ
jgi:integrase